MKAILLAAGRGERMRPLTDHTHKALLKAGKHRLIEYHLLALKQAGIEQCLINTAYLSQQIQDTLGDGSRYGLSIQYSDESQQALETAGGIINALPLLGSAPFLVVNADIWTDYPFAQLVAKAQRKVDYWAHLVLVNNPEHHPAGDFSLKNDKLSRADTDKLTYSGIGVYTEKLFTDFAPGKRPLLPVLLNAIKAGQLSGEHYTGQWMDIGTPSRLEQLDRHLQQRE